MHSTCIYLIATFCLFSQACSVREVRRISMVDEHKHPVNKTVIVPIVSDSTGLSAGSDGNGIQTKEKTYIAKPFEWSSGENLIKQHLQSRLMMAWPLPPYVGVTNRRWVAKWLFLAKGHDPLILTMNEIASNSYVNDAQREPTDRVFILRHSTGNSRASLIDALIAPQPNLIVVSSYLKTPILKANLDHNSLDLLRRQR